MVAKNTTSQRSSLQSFHVGPAMLHGRYRLVLSGHGSLQTLYVAIGPRAIPDFIILTPSTVARHDPR